MITSIRLKWGVLAGILMSLTAGLHAQESGEVWKQEVERKIVFLTKEREKSKLGPAAPPVYQSK